MALIVKDRVQEISTTVGTGTLTLGGAVLGFQSFAAIGDGNTTYYAIADPITGDWEAGIGIYTSSGTTLSRDTVLSSSNGGSLVSFAAGTKNVFCTYPSERAVYLDSAGSYPVQNTFNTLSVTTATITAGTVSTTPTSGTDIANKTYVDNLVAAGTHFHEPVRVESPINLNATYNNGTAGVGATLTNAGTQAALVIDGVTVSVADRVLIYEQTNQTQNGVYVVTDVGSGATNWILTRASDADTYVVDSPNGLSEGSTFFVREGTTGAGETYTCNTTGVITFGTTNITFAQISSAQIYSAGTGLSLSGTTFSITNTAVTPATYGTASSVGTFTVNAQGQITNAVDTTIAISSAAVSGLAASATTDTTNASNISSGTLGTSRLSGSYTGITGVGALAAGSLASGFTAVSAPLGGTGQTSYAIGDILFASTSTALSKLADVAVGNALISGGVGVAPSYGKIGLATHVSGTLPVANGGTGVTSSTGTGSVVLSDSPALVTPALGTPASGNLANCTFPTLNQSTTGNAATATALQTARTIGGVSFNGTANINLPGVNTAGNQNTTGTAAGLSATLVATSGGTGQSSYAVGDLLFASTTTALSKLADVATGSALISGGVGVAPSYGKIGLTTHVSGTLPVANGGTNQTSYTNGQLLIGNTTGNTLAKATLTGTSNQIVVTNGAGSITLSTPQAIGTASSVQFGSFGVGTAASGTTGEIRATNNVTAFYSSDRRLKENIRDIPDALNKACAIGGKLFDWTDAYIAEHGGADGYFVRKADFGVIAQDVKPHLPEAVKTREDGTLAVDYEKLCALAFAAIAELRAEVEALKQQ